jgi:tetraacyldisaccharide 4'-kinase
MSRHSLQPLAAIYGGAVAAKNHAYDHGWMKARRLRSAVVSIGNLSVGGSGKTPLTICLAELLSASGLEVDVLSRGYGRSSTDTERVDPSGNAECFGDEPLLIAQRARVHVYVSASRYEAGLLAEADKNASGESDSSPSTLVHLLDDGFQHRQLARDVDIVVLHRSDLSESLLPAGRLREPLSSLRRASFLVVREEDTDLEAKIRQLGITVPIWWMRRSLQVGELSGIERCVAFCGIARPQEFFSALIAKNVNLELAIPFSDHHRYSSEDIRRLATAAREARATAFITTEKDAVKLTPTLIQQLEAVAPVRIARLEVSLGEEDAIVAQIRANLPRR